ncbi:MAG: primase C-terminal domain-containing protein, partial [Candidatus Acidiferrales bacterium]
AGAMRRLGATEGTILVALQKENLERCEPPLPEQEVANIASSVSRYRPGDGRASRDGLVAILGDDVKFFHTPDAEAYVTIRVNDHHETWRLHDSTFKKWLAARCYDLFEKMPRAQVLGDILAVLEGIALFESPKQRVFTRIGERDGAIYLDLCNRRWEVIEITAHGWRVIPDAPVKFRRARGMRPIRTPKKKGSIGDLRAFLNLSTDNDFVLLVSWLVGALRPKGPYPVLVLQGEAGSAKSTAARVLRALVDANTSPLRSEPRETRDLMIAAKNSWVVAFDNVSHLSWRLSDNLCRLATGGGFSTRQLYTDDDEKLFEATRPILLNGIDGVVTRGDLMDRSMVAYLPVITDTHRKSEKQFWGDFRKAQPRMLGALLDAVSCSLRRLSAVKLVRFPRMADFAQWVTAAEPALGWSKGTFLNAYEANRISANALTLEASVIVAPLRDLCAMGEWKGTAQALLDALHRRVSLREIQQRDWPKNPQVLATHLRRLAPNLRTAGLDLTFGEKTAGRGSKRIITIKHVNAENTGTGDDDNEREMPTELAEIWAEHERRQQGKDAIRRFPREKIRRFPRE